MFSYSPQLRDAIIAAFLCILLLALGSKAQGRVLLALNVGAGMLGVLFIIIVVLLIRESNNRRVEVMTEFANAIIRLDDEGRAMMAFEFPSLRYHMKRGEVREYFETTNVPIELFKYFLQTSDSKYISPRRYWYTADHPEWAWIEIKSWLEEDGMILPDSAAGSHSWMWKGNAWNHLKAYWGTGLKLRDMSDELVMHSPGYNPPVEEGASD